MRTTLPLPEAPALSLPPEINQVVDYIAARYGVHRAVLTTAVLTVLGAVIGGSRRLIWRDDEFRPALHLLILPTVDPASQGWLELLTAPLAARVKLLHSMVKNRAGAVEEMRVLSEQLSTVNLDDPRRAEMEKACSHFGDCLWPGLLLSGMEDKFPDDYFGSSLIADGTGQTLTRFLENLSVEGLRHITQENGKNDPRRFALLLIAMPRHIAKIRERALLANWFPLLLPQTGAAFSESTLEYAKIVATWDTVAKRAFAVRREPYTALTVADGEASLNLVKAAAERAASKAGQPQWFSWATRTCIKIAGILHTLKPTPEPVLSAETWADAVALTKWLIEVQASSIRTIGIRMRAMPKKFHPPKATDGEHLKKLILLHPGLTYRDAVRALPKRPPGYWRRFF